MSLPTSYWGEPIWKTLYTIAYTYPAETDDVYITNLKNLYISLSTLLPCGDCKAHYAEYLEHNPIDKAVHNRQELLGWVNALENSINNHLQRPLKLLEKRIEEMDHHNPDIEQPPSLDYNNFAKPSNNELPVVQPKSQRSTRPVIQRSTRPVVQRSTRPVIQRSTRPVVQRSERPTKQRSSRPTTQLTIRATTKSSIQRSIRSATPSEQPTTQLSRQLTEQPPEQPTTQLTRQLAEQPTEQPVEQSTEQQLNITTRRRRIGVQYNIRKSVATSGQCTSCGNK
jgi:hypothetical protein